MSPATLALAAVLLPAAWQPSFQPAPTFRPEPLLWETPVSWENPACVFPTSLPSPAVTLADFEAVLQSPDRGRLRAAALDGRRALLRQRVAAGEKALYGALIQSLKDEWRNEEALALLPAVLADPDIPAEIKAELRKLEPIMELRLGRYDRAAELWANPADRSEAQWLSQTEYRRGNFSHAAEIRIGLAKKSPAGRARSRELLAAFNIFTRAGLFQEAEALVAEYPELKKTEDFDWRQGLAALAAGETSAAQNSFEAILQDKKSKRHAGARYYLGRSLALAGKRAEARAAYRAAASGPVNYYHILAQGQLKPSAANPAPALEKLLITGPSGRDRDSLGYYLWITGRGFSGEQMEAAAQALAGMETVLAEGRGRADRSLNEELRQLLAARDWDALANFAERHEEIVKNPSPTAKELWLPLAATVAARSGRYRAAFSLLSRAPARPEGGSAWSHPLVYSREALTARRERGLSPALLLALIRTESAYQPDIMSASNARGLMQLLPSTAAKVAARLGQPEPGAAELFDPAVNIRYGSWYLKALIDGFGQEALALAGYNGGPYNIKSLILAKADMPLDIFLDTLPFEETVNYVQRITLARYLYEMSYTGRAHLPDFTTALPLPNESLPDF